MLRKRVHAHALGSWKCPCAESSTCFTDANPAFCLKFKIDVHTTAIDDFNNDCKTNLDRRWRIITWNAKNMWSDDGTSPNTAMVKLQHDLTRNHLQYNCAKRLLNRYKGFLAKNMHQLTEQSATEKVQWFLNPIHSFCIVRLHDYEQFTINSLFVPYFFRFMNSFSGLYEIPKFIEMKTNVWMHYWSQVYSLLLLMSSTSPRFKFVILIVALCVLGDTFSLWAWYCLA